MSNIRHVSDPLHAALTGYLDELLKHAPPHTHAEVRAGVAAARASLREAACIAGVVPRSVVDRG